MTTRLVFFSAFLAGTVSFLSPCVLPLVPGYVSFVAGRSLSELQDTGYKRRRLAVLGLAGCFIAGFSLVFIALGSAASAVGHVLSVYRAQAGVAAGLVIVLFGAQMMGVLRLPWLERDVRMHLDMPGGQPLAAGILGMAFAFGWTPCIGPVLGAILTMAGQIGRVSEGAMLLAVYACGLALPFLLVAAFTDRFLRTAALWRWTGRGLHIISGAILVVVGSLMATDRLGQIGVWLIDNMPMLQRAVF